MRRLWLGLGCVLLVGCADFFKPSDDSEPLPTLNALDSAAIAKMKILMGVWNGNVRDWIRTYSQSGRVKRLNVSLSRKVEIVFPDTGLEYVEDVNVGVSSDQLIVTGFSRFSMVKILTFIGLDGYKLSVWPRGVYLNGNVETFDVGGHRLTGIDDSLRLISKLNWLDVHGNDVRALPEWMYQKTKFSILVFDNHLCNADSAQASWLNSHAESWKSQRCP